jgi:hypothetical protein
MRAVRIDPALRGRATPSVLARMRRAGLRVHQVGQAAYVHDGGRRLRWLLAVTPAPALEARHAQHHRWLIGRGPATALEQRREAAWLAARRRAT